MGVYIKGMTFPKNCHDCDLEYDSFYCRLVGKKTIDIDRDEEKLEGCPLTEVKEPHGDLIDREVIKQDLSDFYNGIVTARRLIDAQDTVIGAEGAEE